MAREGKEKKKRREKEKVDDKREKGEGVKSWQGTKSGEK